MRAIGQGGVDAESAGQAARAVATLRQQLGELQQGQAALELQLKYSSSGSQLAALQPSLEEQQRALARWEGRLGRQLEAIVGMQKSALSARSAGKGGAGPAPALSENSPLQTPQHSGGGLRP